MSKERLEEIKEIFGVHKTQTFADRKTIPFNLDDIEWLIEQAGRVKKLEKKINDIEFEYDERMKDIEWLQFINQRYKQALEFYADRTNYKLSAEAEKADLVEYINEMDRDEGYTARQALESDN